MSKANGLFAALRQVRKAVGLGVATYGNGDRYEGAFVKGKRQGPGKLTYKSGQVAEGDWLNGILVAPPKVPAVTEAPAATEGN